MTISNDLLLGVVIGIFLTILFQGLGRFGRKLTSPGCLFVIFIVAAVFVVLVMTGTIRFQLFA